MKVMKDMKRENQSREKLFTTKDTKSTKKSIGTLMNIDEHWVC
jgi:hypothetical protein